MIILLRRMIWGIFLFFVYMFGSCMLFYGLCSYLLHLGKKLLYRIINKGPGRVGQALQGQGAPKSSCQAGQTILPGRMIHPALSNSLQGGMFCSDADLFVQMGTFQVHMAPFGTNSSEFNML